MIIQGRYYPEGHEAFYLKDDKDGEKQVVQTPGNGIRAYGGLEKIIGLILFIFKKAIYLHDTESNVFTLVNKNSLSEFLLRRHETNTTDAKQMQEKYETHKQQMKRQDKALLKNKIEKIWNSLNKIEKTFDITLINTFFRDRKLLD